MCKFASHVRWVSERRWNTIPSPRQAKMILVFLFAVLSCFAIRGTTALHSETKEEFSDPYKPHEKCEPLTINLCLNFPYNYTIMPNLLGQHKQEDAGQEVHQFAPLVKMKCSSDMRFFLCSLYAPPCTILGRSLPPCRSLCENAKKGCEHLMNSFGFDWPETFACSGFPIYGGDELCVGQDEDTPSEPTIDTHPRMPVAEFQPSSPWSNGARSFEQSYGPIQGGKLHGFVCPVQFKVPHGLGYSLKVGEKVEYNCGAPCEKMFFSERELKFARVWIGTWAALCAASCFFTFLTFLIDTERFRWVFLLFLVILLFYDPPRVAAGQEKSKSEEFEKGTLNYYRG